MPKLSKIGAKIAVDTELPFPETLVHMLWDAVEAEPATTAVIYEDREISYREFGRAVNGLAHRFRALAGRGDRVILMMPNTIELDVALMAVMCVGAQAVPVNPFFTMGELEKMFGDIDASLIVCIDSMREKADRVAAKFGITDVITLGPGGVELEIWTKDSSLDVAPTITATADDLCLLIFTGGSTGIPKGVDHTHRGFIWSLVQHVSVWPLTFGKETFLNVAPMFHIWGLAYATWIPIYSHSTLIMVPKYEPEKVIAALDHHRVTVFAGGPAPIYMGLLARPEFDAADLSALRYCLSGGAPCPADLHRAWLARAGQPLLEGWGMTEGAPFCLNPYTGQRRLLSVGNPVPATEVEVVDVETGEHCLPLGEAGEVRVRGPQIMRGYRNNPEETAQTLRDGFVYTGDIGYVDEDGFLFLVDRKKDMVLVGGYNVYPREVDEVLFNHPGIREAATIGRRDDKLGEVVVAFVVLEEGSDLDEDSFFAYCKENLVKYKRPVDVCFVESLPRTGTNKINRLALREQLAGMASG